MALGVVGFVPAQGIVVRGDVDGDLVVECAAAGVVELLQYVPGRIAVALAILCVRSDMINESSRDGPVFDGVRGTVVETAEAEGFLGAVLSVGAIAGIEKGSEAVIAVAVSRTGRERKGSTAMGALVRILQDGSRVVTRGLDDGPLLVWVPLHSVGYVNPPVCRRGGFIDGGRSLGKDRDRGQGGDEEPLEGDHVSDE